MYSYIKLIYRKVKLEYVISLQLEKILKEKEDILIKYYLNI